MPDYTTMTAVPHDVVEPFTFIGKNQIKESGSMINYGDFSLKLKAGQFHQIAEGYYNGNGIISAISLEDQTPGSTTPEKMVEGKTAWVNGILVTGTARVLTDGGSNREVSYDGNLFKMKILPGIYKASGRASSTDTTIWTALSPYINLSHVKHGLKMLSTTNIGTFTSDGNVTADKVRYGRTCYSQGMLITGTLQITTLY